MTSVRSRRGSVLDHARLTGTGGVSRRHVPATTFGVLMSINPVFAALIGAAALHEGINALTWAGIGLIVCSNTAVLLLPARTGVRAGLDPAPPMSEGSADPGTGSTSLPAGAPR